MDSDRAPRSGCFTEEPVTFHGTRAFANLEDYFPLLLEHFRLDYQNYDSIKDLTFTGCWASDSADIVDFVPFDIRARATDYGKYLATNLLMSRSEALIERFKKETDFNALYGLKKDGVLPLKEWAKSDPIASLYAHNTSFEDRQVSVCEIQLIPKVPQDVQTTFKRAKDAYILGYFRYDFFTVAVHYAPLAIEAAIKARWSATLPQKINLSYKTAQTEMLFPSYTKIFDACLKSRWRGSEVLVNNERFPFSTESLLNWLVSQKVVSNWERKLLRLD